MKSKLAFLLAVGFVLFLLSSCVRSRNWTRADTNRQAVFTAVELVDWGQTRRIVTERTQHSLVTRPDGSSTETFGGRNQWQEFNPLLGEHPSIGTVNAYFPAVIVGDALLAYLLPPEWRAGFQCVSIGAGLVTVTFNLGNGLGIGW
jgi:hypothetical protein